MRAKISILIGTVICLAACKKDEYSTAPQLTFKKVSSTVINPGDDLIFTIGYTDREGDIQDTLYIQKNVLNCSKGSISFNDGARPIPGDVPQVKDSKGDIEVRYSRLPSAQYENLGDPQCTGVGGVGVNDSCVYSFYLKDKAGHISDTVSSPIIVITAR
jgi:hypothetical protein